MLVAKGNSGIKTTNGWFSTIVKIVNSYYYSKQPALF